MRSRLIERAELLVRSRADSCDGDAKEIVARWESERAVTEEIYGMTRDLPGPPRGICTPRFAARFGKAGGMLALIRRCSMSQEGERHLLDLGAWYSEAAPVLFCGLDGDIDKASEMLAPGQPDDPFSELALRRAAFICGLVFLDTADKKALKHFRTAVSLFETSKVFEEQLIEKVFEVEEMEALKLCEQVLALIVDEHPTGGLKQALSTVSTRVAIDRCNRGEMGLDAFTLVIEKALALDPANEEARIAKGDAQVDLEIKALNQALERHKMARACEIAERSQHPETRETFFTFMENIFDLFSRKGMTRAESVFMVNNLYKWCERVDPEHPFLDEIGKELVALSQS
jgi:hypothetical protein